MRLTARQIVDEWLSSGVNLAGIERALELEFGSLKMMILEEGPAPPEMEALLNIVNTFPWLIAVVDNKFIAGH